MRYCNVHTKWEYVRAVASDKSMSGAAARTGSLEK